MPGTDRLMKTGASKDTFNWTETLEIEWMREKCQICELVQLIPEGINKENSE